MTVELLLVRGAPGVGKREVVKRLRPHITNGAVVDVELFRAMFARPSRADRQQHLVAMQLARSTALDLISRQVRPVVVIDTFTSGKLAGFVANLPHPYLVASLFLESETLRTQLIARRTAPRDIESALIINTEVAVRRHEHDSVFDVSGRDPDEIAATLRKWLRRQ